MNVSDFFCCWHRRHKKYTQVSSSLPPTSINSDTSEATEQLNTLQKLGSCCDNDRAVLTCIALLLVALAILSMGLSGFCLYAGCKSYYPAGF